MAEPPLAPISYMAQSMAPISCGVPKSWWLWLLAPISCGVPKSYYALALGPRWPFQKLWGFSKSGGFGCWPQLAPHDSCGVPKSGGFGCWHPLAPISCGVPKSLWLWLFRAPRWPHELELVASPQNHGGYCRQLLAPVVPHKLVRVPKSGGFESVGPRWPPLSSVMPGNLVRQTLSRP